MLGGVEEIVKDLRVIAESSQHHLFEAFEVHPFADCFENRAHLPEIQKTHVFRVDKVQRFDQVIADEFKAGLYRQFQPVDYAQSLDFFLGNRRVFVEVRHHAHVQK